MTRQVRLIIVLALAATWSSHAIAANGDDERFEALMGLGRVKRDAGDMDGARRFFDEARKVREFREADLTEVLWIVAASDPRSAIPVGQSLLRTRPGRADVRDRTIAAAVAVREESVVETLAAGGRREEPANPLWPRRLAESYLRRGMANRAVSVLHDIATRPDSTTGDRALLAIALETSGDRVSAAAAWEKVPRAERASRPDWERSRLRAIAWSAPAPVAASELEPWLAAHPDDEAMQGELVDLWMRAGDADRALDVLTTLLEGPNQHVWRRRAVRLRETPEMRQAIARRVETRLIDGKASADERWILADALADVAAFERAAAVGTTLITDGDVCDERLLSFADRLPGAAGTELVLRVLDARRCAEHPAWIVRGVERAVADGLHADARRLLDRLPHALVTGELARLDGQLRLWTGDAAGAIDRLTSFVERHPADRAARESLVDALRTIGQSYTAWRAAAPLVETTGVSADRLLMFAELALEADQPSAVSPILARIPDGPETAITKAGLLGRALVAAGRPADAIGVFSSLDVSRLSPASALAIIDATLAVKGVDAALETARAFDGHSPAWRDVIGRRIVLAELSGDNADADRQQLARIDDAVMPLVDADLALARERPQDALIALSGIDGPRADDLRASALTGTGNLDTAAAIVDRLRQSRPEFVPYALRATELAWRQRPDADTLAAMAALPSRFPGNQYAAMAAARALAESARHADALDALGAPDTWRHLPVDGRVQAARSLHAIGRPADALALIDDVRAAGRATALFRAELTAVVIGPREASAQFRALASLDDSDPETFLVWANHSADLSERLGILREGSMRFSNNAPLAARLAAASAASGDARAAIEAATRAVALDPHSGDAWFHLIDQTQSMGDRGAIVATLDRFHAAAAGSPALLLEMAERAAGLVRPDDDLMVNRALGWLDEPLLGAAALQRDLARIRLLAAAERWPEATASAERARAVHGDRPAVLRLRADVLSWAGRHDEALAGYADYLAVAPGDLDVVRQQARVAGWAGRAADAEHYYARLRTAAPDDAPIAAEMLAKVAFLEGRWREAVDHYRNWIALVPDEGEARFEYAEALRASGREKEADRVLDDLIGDTGHRLAAATRDRARLAKAPVVAVLDEHSSSNGYDGQRLLDLGERGGSVSATIGRTELTRLGGSLTHVDAASADERQRGYRAAMWMSRSWSPAIDVRGRVSWLTLGTKGPVTEAQATVVWKPVDRWMFSGGVERSAVAENLGTIERRLTASGLTGTIGFETPHATMEIASSWHTLSDGNVRARGSFTATRAISERLDHVRLVAWGDVLSYRAPSSTYFAPGRFLRLDGGVEYTFRHAAPRFRGDRRQDVTAGWLIGVDSRGTIYRHPTVRAAWEISRGIAIDARAGMIRSRTYNDTSASVSLRVSSTRLMR